MGAYLRNPVEFGGGEGTRLWDDEGNEYLDFLAGISVAQLGHCHPAVVAAVRDQAGPAHARGQPLLRAGMRLAARLSELSLGGKVFLCNSGTEAIECAIKLARRSKPGGDFVVLEGGFHGRTMGALATPRAKQAPFAPLVPGFRVAPRDGPLRVDERTAAVLIEPIQGEGGIHPIRRSCSRRRAPLRRVRRAADLRRDPVRHGADGQAVGLAGLRGAPGRHDRRQGPGGGLPVGACVTAPSSPMSCSRATWLSCLRGRAGDRRGGEHRARHRGRGGLPRVAAKGERLAAGCATSAWRSVDAG